MCKQCPKGTTGAVVWEGPSAFDGAPIVVIVTWHSTNKKTGDMAQTWILRGDVLPTDAIASGEDASICGECPHRRRVHADGSVRRTCYVNVGQAPQTVWRTYQAGGYPVMLPIEAASVLAGRGVRLGAYGDPGMVPLAVWEALTAKASMWTGYSHQWRSLSADWARFLMASADTVADRRDARRAGWRAFYVAPKDTTRADGAVMCLSDARGTSCLDCGACAGQRREGSVAVDIFIAAHGGSAAFV